MEDEKLSGRVIIDTVLANMREQVEELRYSKVVPAAYDVYLHADDQRRFESLAHEIAAEAVRALQERLDALNRSSRLDRVREIVRKPRLPFKKVGPWLVRITQDPEGAVPRGRALVISQIALAGAESFEGQRTRRLATLSQPSGASPETAEGIRDVASRFAAETHPRPGAGAEPNRAEAPHTTAALVVTGVADETARVPDLAVLTWEDDAGSHRFRMAGHEMTLGRTAQGSNADLQIATLPDVSRVHCRVRYHPEGPRFSIEDLSLLGTTVNGETIPRGTPEDLPSPADIRLAGAITLRFQSEALP